MMRDFGVIALVAALAAAAPQAPGALAQDSRAVVETGDWQARVNKTVVVQNHWKWTLRRVERQGDTLSVRLSVKNDSNTGRPLLLDEAYLDSFALVDDLNGKRFRLRSVDGMSGEVTPVDRNQSASASFTFDYPVAAHEVRFIGQWISARMGGEANFMDVEFPIEIPPRGARPI